MRCGPMNAYKIHYEIEIKRSHYGTCEPHGPFEALLVTDHDFVRAIEAFEIKVIEEACEKPDSAVVTIRSVQEMPMARVFSAYVDHQWLVWGMR